MAHSIKHFGPLVARTLLVLLFLVSGFGIVTNIAGTAGFYASVGIPLATIAVILVLIVKFGGSLMVISGIHAREGAWALIIFTVLATLIGHTGEGQLVAALKNISIVGGLLMVAIHGAGPLSLDHKCPCPRHKKKQGTTGVASSIPDSTPMESTPMEPTESEEEERATMM